MLLSPYHILLLPLLFLTHIADFCTFLPSEIAGLCPWSLKRRGAAQKKLSDQVGIGLIEIQGKAAAMLQHLHSVQAILQKGHPESPRSGPVHNVGSAFCSEVAAHTKVHCRFPVSQPLGPLVWWFHTRPDYIAYSSPASPRSGCFAVGNEVTCSIFVGCILLPAFFVILSCSAALKKEGFSKFWWKQTGCYHFYVLFFYMI